MEPEGEDMDLCIRIVYLLLHVSVSPSLNQAMWPLTLSSWPQNLWILTLWLASQTF